MAEREAPATAEDLANGANRRFWQIALEDPANQGKVPAELREVIHQRGADSIAEAFGDLARTQWDLDGPGLAGVSPALLRSLAVTTPADAGQYLAAAAAAYANGGRPLTPGQIEGALALGQLTRLEGSADLSWWVVHPPTGERVVLLRKLAADSRAGALRLGGE